MGTVKTIQYYKLKGTILHETEKAIQFNIDSVQGEYLEDSQTEWFPISQTKSITRTSGQGTDEIEVAEWLLKRKELI